jgi:hypothetical protein
LSVIEVSSQPFELWDSEALDWYGDHGSSALQAQNVEIVVSAMSTLKKNLFIEKVSESQKKPLPTVSHRERIVKF